MEKTIYNVNLLLENKAQTKRIFDLLKKYEIPIFEDILVFDKYSRNLNYNSVCGSFSNWYHTNTTTQVTEQEFIELLKTTK